MAGCNKASFNCSKPPDTSLMSSLEGCTAQSDINLRLKFYKTSILDAVCCTIT